MKDQKASHLTNLPLWQAWREHGDIDAKKDLIENYLPLVDYVTNRMSIGLPKNVIKEDLASHGVMGLIDAIEKFDYLRGLQFETYASWRIRGAIIDGLRQGDWVPRSVREKAKKIEEAYQFLEQKHMRSITDTEICNYLELNEKEFAAIVQDISISTVFSLEEPLREEESETRMSLLIDQSAKRPESTVDDVFLKASLEKGIDRLTEKERTVISLFYYEDLSLSEIAEVMSLSPSRISQLHSKAIQRLRGVLEQYKAELFRS
ncbi:FliA/WhiG family RNA polymerase sigma factor [Paenibacillus septentrionalis]|uniref:FliA/WhiG family RNA polymerase sigma factor n=1 Tax=Paenibacillus septentrionalis TaxID=429342 RepID=A0ABW1V094_9BACL